jgi:hypothetical protein
VEPVRITASVTPDNEQVGGRQVADDVSHSSLRDLQLFGNFTDRCRWLQGDVQEDQAVAGD